MMYFENMSGGLTAPWIKSEMEGNLYRRSVLLKSSPAFQRDSSCLLQDRQKHTIHINPNVTISLAPLYVEVRNELHSESALHFVLLSVFTFFRMLIYDRL